MASRTLDERNNLEYNTDRSFLVLPEYGRYLQKLAVSISELEDPEEQLAYIEKSIDIIVQLFPESKSVDNYREKLWHDLYYMSGFDIKALPPSGIRPTYEDQQLKPAKLNYPVHRLDYKHYGYNVQVMIQKALNMEDGPIKQEFVEVIGAYMKLAYKTWNKEHFVSDDMIRQDLAMMTKGALTINEEKDLDVLLASQIKKRFLPSVPQNQNWKKKKNNSGHKSKNRR